MGLPTVVALFFPGGLTYSPQRALRYMKNPFWSYAEVEQAQMQHVPEFGQQAIPLVFKDIAIPQQQMHTQLLSGNVRLIYNDQIYVIREVREDRDLVISLLGVVDDDYTPQTFQELSVGDASLTADGDTLSVLVQDAADG